MIRRVIIYDGALWAGEHPALVYKLAPLDDAPHPIREFRGDANIEGNRLVLWKGDPRFATEMHEYLVADKPTDDSLQYMRGWEHAMKQARCAWPNGKPEQFVQGWRDAWTEKDPAFAKRRWITVGGKVVQDR